MKNAHDKFLDMFEEIDTAEDCPVGVNLLVWDGCEFIVDYVDVDAENGAYYFANNTDGIAYFELPEQTKSESVLGNGE